MRYLKALYGFILITFVLHSSAQTHISSEFGLHIVIGSAVRKIGVYTQSSVRNSHLQINARISPTYNFKHWGNASRTPELQVGTAVFYAYKDDIYSRLKKDFLSQETSYSSSFGYAIKWYFDKNQTSQRTGTLIYQVNEWRYIFENDMFAKKMSDKYRTAAFKITYTHFDQEYQLQLLMWTGSFNGVGAKKVRNDSTFKARYGYFDLTNSPHGLESHGILSFGVTKDYTFAPPISYSLGIDAEQVRNIFQNKFIHDSWFLPDFMIPYKNLHFPMICDDGSIYLYKNGQKIRKPKLYYQIGTGESMFY